MSGYGMIGMLVGSAAVRARTAFSLVEVVLAIGIISFGLLLLVALIPVGLKTIEHGKTEELAMELLNATAVEFRSIPPGSNSRTPLRDFDLASGEVVPTFDLFGQLCATSDDSSYFRLRARRRSTTPSTRGDWWHLRLEWPAAAAEPTGYLESLVLVPASP